ncbi:excalibur calcium-binding domain-containing protein [Streptomyces venezuelae]|uniref:excalibur calcium-binding domain-containing protein n=1 Tax=Streptomyces venezuelae TaxID=54571 RepID=UPI00331B358E
MTYSPPYPYPPAPAPVRRWWQHPALVIAALIVLPPVGIALVWAASGWSQGKKILATVLAGLWFISPFLGDGDAAKKGGEDAKAAVAAPSSVPGAASNPTPAASTSPTAAAAASMPNVVGTSYGDAMAALKTAGIGEAAVTLDDVYLDIDAPTHAKAAADGDWKVCFQSPDKGGALPAGAKVRLDLGQWSEASIVKQCPAAKGTTYQIPANDPDQKKPSPTQESSSTGGSSGTGGGGSVYYKNCAAAKAAGAAPVRRGDPGYGKHLDKDGDGTACE